MYAKVINHFKKDHMNSGIFGADGTTIVSQVPVEARAAPGLQLNVFSLDDAADVIADSNIIVQTARKLGKDSVEILIDSRKAVELRAKLQGVFSPKVLRVKWHTFEVPGVNGNVLYSPPQRPPVKNTIPIQQGTVGVPQVRVEAQKPIGRPPNPSKMSPDLLKAAAAQQSAA